MEENSEHPQTESLLKDLSTEALSTEYNALKEQYDDMTKREQQARQELERTQNLLVESQKAAAVNQQDKEKAENKLADTTNLKHDSISLVSSLRQSMALLRSDNSKLSQENKDWCIKIIKVETEKNAEHYQNETLKLQISDLHLRVNNLIKSEEGTRRALLTAENDIKQQNESMRNERERFTSQHSQLEKERDLLMTVVQDLRQQLSKSNIDIESAKQRASTAEERIQKMESSRLATKKVHDGLIEVYEKQRLESEQRIAKLTEEMDRMQQKTTRDRSQLELDNEKLQEQLTGALDKLQVTRSSLDKLLGNDGTTTTSPDDTSSSTTGAPFVSGNLVKMIRQYESTGRHWDDIFSDFFDLRSTNSQLNSINNELTKTNRQLLRERDDQQQCRDLMESELERLRTERVSQSSLSDNYTKLKISSTQQVSQLEAQVDQLVRNNQDLDASLNDTSYQLRYLIRHVESQNGTLPAEVPPPNDLLGDAHIPPTISHDKVVFKDITELQERNQELLTEIRHLTTQLEEKTIEARSNADTAKEQHDLLSDTTSKSTALIRDQNEKIQALELRLSMAMSERDRLLKQIPESGDASSVAPNSSDNQDKLQQADQRYKQLLDDTVAYRKEMEAELQEQREELQHIRAEASTLRQEYNGALLEIDQHKQRNIGLSHVSASRQNEIDDLRRRAIARESHVEKLEAHILSLNNELLNLSRDMEALRNDHSSVQSQLAASNTSYQRLLDTNKDLATERGNLKTLLQDMNERLASSTTGTTHLVEELKQHNERLSRELQNLRDTLTAKEKELRGHQAIDQSEWKDKYQTSVGELKQLKATVLDLEQKLATANQDRMVAQAKLNEALKNSTTVASTTSDTVDDVGVDSSNDPLVEQVKLLADANNQIISLKKELFDVKGRLADADATANKITEAYNTFTSESQVRIDKLSDDLATSNEKVDTMQTDMEKVLTEQKEAKAAHATLELQWESTKAALTEENQQLQSKTTALSTQITNVQAELDAKIEQLQQSEDRYQIQVADRAKDADTIGNLRDEIRQLNADIMTSKTEVLSAQERLRSAELSYRNQREQLETEQNDMKLRLEESQKQQEALADSIQKLVTKIHEFQTTSGSAENGTITHLAESATQQLRDVNTSLRRDKDIWYARFTEAQQRATRMESDLEFVQHQLSTTRALLETIRAEKDETARKQSDGIKDAQNEAALYKESNISLRDNVDKLSQQVTQLESLVATKETEMEPLKLKAQGLEHELKQTKDLVDSLKQKQAEWNARSAQLLSKHNIPDPQDVEKLKSELEQAKAQLEEKTQSLGALEKQHQELVSKTADTETSLEKATENVARRGKWIMELKKKITLLEKTVATHEEQMKKQEEQLNQQQQQQQQQQQSQQSQQPQQPQQPQQTQQLQQTQQPQQDQQDQQKEPQEELKGEHKDSSTKQEDSGGADKIKELEDALKKLQEERAAQSVKHSGLMSKARTLLNENKTYSSTVATLTEEKSALTTQLEAIKTELEEVKKQLATKTSEVSALQVEIGRMKAMHSMTTNKNEKLKKQVLELQQKLQGSQPSGTSTEAQVITETPPKPSPSSPGMNTTPSTPPITTVTVPLPVSSPATVTDQSTVPATTVPLPTDTSSTDTSNPPPSTPAESSPAPKEETSTATPTETVSPSPATTPNPLKRGQDEDPESLPPAKK